MSELKPLNVTGEDNTSSSLVIQNCIINRGAYFWTDIPGYSYPQLGESGGWEEARTNLFHLRHKFPERKYRLVIVTTEVLSE